MNKEDKMTQKRIPGQKNSDKMSWTCQFSQENKTLSGKEKNFFTRRLV